MNVEDKMFQTMQKIKGKQILNGFMSNICDTRNSWQLKFEIFLFIKNAIKMTFKECYKNDVHYLMLAWDRVDGRRSLFTFQRQSTPF